MPGRRFDYLNAISLVERLLVGQYGLTGGMASDQSLTNKDHVQICSRGIRMDWDMNGVVSMIGWGG